MKQDNALITSSHSRNIFGLLLQHPFWQQLDFWLACLAALIFWLALKLLYLDSVLIPTTSYLTFTLISLVIIFPVLEEIVFRGLIQEAIQKLLQSYQIQPLLLWRISTANLLASVCFSLTHLSTHPFLWALATLIPSLIFGYFKDKYQSLMPSIILHILYNFGFYLLI